MMSIEQACPGPLDIILANFRVALANQEEKDIESIWRQNPLLQSWYYGEQVFVGHGVNIGNIPHDVLIHDFQTILFSRSEVVIQNIWENNASLRAWICGKQVIIDNNPSGPLIERSISLLELTSLFKSVLLSRSVMVIQAIWDEHPELRSWCSGKAIHFVNQFGQSQLIAISFDELIDTFKYALASQVLQVISAMWINNLILRKWYGGQQIRSGNTQEVRAISFDELINGFYLALSSKTPFVISAMWNGNDVLHHTINSLDNNRSKLMLNKVIEIYSPQNRDFVTRYINKLENSNIMLSVLDEYRKENKNKRLPSKMVLLRKRYIELVQPSHSHSTKKHNELLQAKSSRGKKQKVKIDDTELSHSIKKMPEHSLFFIEPALVGAPHTEQNIHSEQSSYNPGFFAQQSVIDSWMDIPNYEKEMSFKPEDDFEPWPFLPLPFDLF